MEPLNQITKEEKKAIAALKRLAKKWPKSLWLFSGAGTLTIMKKNINGERAILPIRGGSTDGGVDQDFAIDTINIENDGGDW